MVYYKLIRDGKIFQVATSDDVRKLQQKHNVLSRCDPSEVEYIQIEDDLYRDKWMRPVAEGVYGFEEVEIRAVFEEEYKIILETLKKGEEIKELVDSVEDNVPPEPVEEPVEEFVSEPTIEFVKETKIKEMSLACNKAIVAGFDVSLSDGESHHFSLTLQDQANLTSIQVQILSGATEIPYHADDEESKMYSVEDMAKIVGAADGHKTYHLVYFNALKGWINNLKRVTSISAIKYGSEIPKRYQTPLLRELMEE